MTISASAVVQNLVAMVKYVVLLVIVVAGFKLLCRDVCSVASEDPGMRPAIGSTRTWLGYDRDAWAASDLAVGDIVMAYAETGQSGQDSRAFPFRVVAVGGDWLMIAGGTVVRYKDADDRQGQLENYPGAEIRPYNSMAPLPRFQIPRGYVFLMADNRVSSVAASPFLTPVSRLIGKARL